MAEGIIKRLVPDKGFGFIKDNDSGSDVFFHRSAVRRPSSFENLREGDRLHYELEHTDKGLRASDVSHI